LLCASIGAGLCGPATVAARDGGLIQASAARDDLAVPWRTLRQNGASPAESARAAESIIAAANEAAVREEIETAIKQPLVAGGAGAALLGAITRASWPSPDLFLILARRLEGAGSDEIPTLLGALGSFRTMPAATLLVSYTGEHHASPIRSAAFSALTRLSGRDDLGTDRGAWEAWAQRARTLTNEQWESELLRGLARRADRASSQRREAGTRLTDALRRVHIRTPADERSILLAEWMQDPLPEVRDLGLELVSRELADTGRLDTRIGEAALRLLAHGDPAVRSSAAVLVRQLAPVGASEAVLMALSKETDERAAAALLLAAARWPSPSAASIVMGWLERSGAASSGAWEAALALSNAGVLDEAQRHRVLDAARRDENAARWPAACTLMCELGDDNDRDRALSWLETGSAAVRIAVADSLLWYPEYLNAILRAASANQDLYGAAVRAAVVHAPTAATFAQVAALPAATPQSARDGLLLLAGRLSAPDLWTVIRDAQDETLQAALLPELANENRVLSEGRMPEKQRAIARGVLLMAESDLQRGDAAGALAALDGSPVLSAIVPPSEGDPLRAAALIALGRLAEADDLDVPPAAAIRGLQLSRGAAHERTAARMILDRYGDALSAEQRAEAEASLVSALPGDDFVGPPVPR